MTFADLVSGQSVFLDANTFVYHFQPHPVSLDTLRRKCTHRPRPALYFARRDAHLNDMLRYDVWAMPGS